MLNVQLASSPLILPAIEATTPLRRARRTSPTVLPDQVTCASCDREFPGEMTRPDGDGRVCFMCEVDDDSGPRLRRETSSRLLSAGLYVTLLATGTLIHGGWSVYNAVTATTGSSAYSAATIFLIGFGLLSVTRAYGLARNGSQIRRQDAWAMPGWIAKAHPVGAAALLLGGGLTAIAVSGSAVAVGYFPHLLA